jgi:hypothetical protein
MATRRSVRSFAGKHHYHGCKRCHIRYDDACQNPEENELCAGCRGGKPWVELVENAMARPHCRSSARLADKDEISLYKLVGSAIWFICQVCKRTFPYDDPKHFTDDKIKEDNYVPVNR